MGEFIRFDDDELAQDESVASGAEWIEIMKKDFPDYPCAKCERGGVCVHNSKCPAWKSWFKETWRDIQNTYRRDRPYRKRGRREQKTLC